MVEVNDDGTSTGLVREMWDFLFHTKKWQLPPILVMLVRLALLTQLSSTDAAPLVDTLF